MPVRVSDLIDQTGKPGLQPILRCNLCGEENSANKSDYFLQSDDHVFRHCGEDMQLVMKKTIYEVVKLPQKKNCATNDCPNVAVFIAPDRHGYCGPCYKKSIPPPT